MWCTVCISCTNWVAASCGGELCSHDAAPQPSDKFTLTQQISSTKMDRSSSVSMCAYITLFRLLTESSSVEKTNIHGLICGQLNFYIKRYQISLGTQIQQGPAVNSGIPNILRSTKRKQVSCKLSDWMTLDGFRSHIKSPPQRHKQSGKTNACGPENFPQSVYRRRDAGTPEDSITGTKLVRQKIFSRGAPE